MSGVFLGLGVFVRRATTSRSASSTTAVNVRPLSKANRLASLSSASSRRMVVLITPILAEKHQYVNYHPEVLAGIPPFVEMHPFSS
jgi:hypothetical protein